MWKCIGTALVMLMGGWLAPAQAQVNLQWKFEKGESFYVEDVTKTKATVSVMGMTQNQDTQQTVLAKFTVLEKNSDGSMVMERKIEGFKITSEMPLPGIDDIAKQMEGVTFKVTFKPNLEVSKVEGIDEFFNKLANANPIAGQALRAMMSEDTLKAALSEVFTNLPNKTVSMGDKWTRKSTIPLGPLGSLTADANYTYAGMQDGLHKVTFTGAVSFQPPKAGAGGLPFQITKTDLKAEEMKGTLFYDATKGKVARSESKLKMKMSMTANAGGQNLQLDIDQDMTMSSRILDKKP